LPFCAEKRSSLLHESEGIFVALLGKQSSVVTKVRQYRGAARQFCVATQLATPLGTKKKKKYTMNSDPMDTSCIDLDNTIDSGSMICVKMTG
jgi:hypothetical protein